MDRSRLVDQIQNDLKALSLESKRSKQLTALRNATEEAIVNVRNNMSKGGDVANVILMPVVHGCESKDPKIIKQCLALLQRLIIHDALDRSSVKSIVQTLWMLCESSSQSSEVLVKLVQTLTLLLTTTTVVIRDELAKCLVMAFKLHFSPTSDPTVVSVAGASVRQLVPAVVERVDAHSNEATLSVFISDAFMMMQDLARIVSADQPVWLIGMTEMTRAFGLELIESVLLKFSDTFKKLEEFRALLKESLCPLVIRLFSPNAKFVVAHHNGGINELGDGEAANFAITSRLVRVLSILVLQYHTQLRTETEIFLSLLIRFLSPDKPAWQNCMALEVIHKVVIDTELIVFVAKEMDNESSKVLQDVVNGLAAYVQNVMMSRKGTGNNNELNSNQQDNDSNASHMASTLAITSGNKGVSTTASAFCYRGMWVPIVKSGGKDVFLLAGSNAVELPNAPLGYGLSLAFTCLLDLVTSIQSIVDEQQGVADGNDNVLLLRDIVNSTWCGVLSALSLLLDASTDETTTQQILDALAKFTGVCGNLEQSKMRDAFLASICKASLPPHYTLTVLKATATTQNVSGPQIHHNTIEGPSNTASQTKPGHQIVVVGTPLPTESLPQSAHQGPVMLTSKNLQCMKVILNVALQHGQLLGNAWHIVLTTLQHLVWILGLKPTASTSQASTVMASKSLVPLPPSSSSSSLPSSSSSASASEPGSSSSSSSSVVTTAVLADLPILSGLLSRLFESSSQLSELSLKHMIDSLCILSTESMTLLQISSSPSKEPSLFAVAKLLETGLANLVCIDDNRLLLVWRPITSHLLIVCNQSHLKMRQWGCEALTFLTRQALITKAKSTIVDQTLLLAPLSELSVTSFVDVRQKQLDTVLHILHAARSGNPLNRGWPLILSMIAKLEFQHEGGSSSSSNETLVRSAFQCLQLVFNDYLPMLPHRCYPQCVEAAAIFGKQTSEMNVSLTSVGLLWNLSDYFFQNVKTLEQKKNENKDESGNESEGKNDMIFPEFPGCQKIDGTFDKLWMFLYFQLKDLCIDERPAIRKSAGQTLFSTIAAHGSVLMEGTWHAVLWQVLFPLLDSVLNVTSQATTSSESPDKSLMIHHSRNTTSKQWNETKVLTVSGVVRVFNTKRKLLRSMEDYAKAWHLLLDYVEQMALNEATEVALAALKAMQEMIFTAGEEYKSSNSSLNTLTTAINWRLCWKAWLKIGDRKANFYLSSTTLPSMLSAAESHQAHIQLLTGHTHLLENLLFPFLEKSFTPDNVVELGKVLTELSLVPLENDLEANKGLTSIHRAVIEAVGQLERLVNMADVNVISNMAKNTVLVYLGLVDTWRSSCTRLTMDANNNDSVMSTSTVQTKLSRFHVRLMTLSEVSMERLADFFVELVHRHSYPNDFEFVVSTIVDVCRNCMMQKHRKQVFSSSSSTPSSSLWRTAVTTLCRVLKAALPHLREEGSSSNDTSSFNWPLLADSLETFLFPDDEELGANKTVSEDRNEEEAIDCQLVELLRHQVLPFASSLPATFVERIVILLNRGSIHNTSVIQLNEDCTSSVGLREDFAKLCFQTLLDFSLLQSAPAQIRAETASSPSSLSATATNRVAISALLGRFKQVLVEAIEGEKLNKNIPLHRQKTAEIAFVLRSIATVVSSLKRRHLNTDSMETERATWQQVIALFPLLVQCTEAGNNGDITKAVKEALLEYADLLQAPSKASLGEFDK